MADRANSMIPGVIQNGFINLLSPVIHALARWRINPNLVSVLGGVFITVGALAFVAENMQWGGVLILLGGICDLLDGGLARLRNKATRFGALLDSTIDRYAEFVMFVGLAIYFAHTKAFFTLTGTAIALCGSLMVSYVRARAEGLGFECKVGMMQRQERILFLGIGALTHLYVLKAVVWIIAVLANFTTWQRIRHVYHQGMQKSKDFGEDAGCAPDGDRLIDT